MLKDTTREIEEMQNDLWMKKTPQERAAFQSAMFAANRAALIASLPANLSADDLKKEMCLRMYGRDLSDDFFNINLLNCRKQFNSAVIIHRPEAKYFSVE